jgi:hypothetical protein
VPGSGFCALVYQVAWLRDFRLIFGASTAASAAVLAIFIGGLGVGGVWIGPRADRHARPLVLYAQLELIVAASAAATPLPHGRSIDLSAAAGQPPREHGATIARVVLSAIVLAGSHRDGRHVTGGRPRRHATPTSGGRT